MQGKDVFEAFYKKDLAKRLLLGRRQASTAPAPQYSAGPSAHAAVLPTAVARLHPGVSQC